MASWGSSGPRTPGDRLLNRKLKADLAAAQKLAADLTTERDGLRHGRPRSQG